MSTSARVVGLHVYPIKSCAGVSVTHAALEERGLAHDRRWMVVDASGRFVSQRKHPILALATPELHPDGALTVRAPEHAPLSLLSTPDAASPDVPVEVWGDRFSAKRGPDQAHAWFSNLLGFDARLVRLTDASDRPVDPDHDAPSPGAQVSFADGFPYLVTTTATLDHVDALVAEHTIDWRRFRPNVVLEVLGAEPFVEDTWSHVQGDGFALHCVKPCTRCVMITVDPERGVHAGPEPTRTLANLQPDAGKVTLGQNALRTGSGVLSIGDTLTTFTRGA